MTEPPKPLEIVLAGQRGDRQKLLSALEHFCEANRLPSDIRNAADLALEEHLTNVLNYGYDETGAKGVLVRFSILPPHFVIVIVDDGKPFNPLDRPHVDTSQPLDEKPIGGLGIHLIRKFMDELEYRREGNQNILTMRKRIPVSQG